MDTLLFHEQSTSRNRLPIDDVRFLKELYPRLKEDDAAIERYRAAIDRLPPIVIARGGVLVDGYHRWQAYKREKLTEIPAEDLGDLTDAEILRESIRRNAAHGQQLSRADKQRLAGVLWAHLGALPIAERVDEIANLLSVSRDAAERWSKDARQLEKQQQQDRSWDLWLDCWSQREIADEIGVDQATISRWIDANTADAAFASPPESRQHFDIWNFQAADGESSYFGRMPPQVVENLLWFYTDPGDICVDLFAGGGTTIDVAKAMGRRVWASDLTPCSPMLPIHQHDILTGWPKDAPNRANFILLDPPYWHQAKGKYSERDNDLSNLSLHDFYDAWANIVSLAAAHLDKNGGKLAYIISPTQMEDGSVIDHATDMLPACDDAELSIVRRIIVPYQTQQATGQQVTWARENKRMLKLYRDLVILERQNGGK